MSTRGLFGIRIDGTDKLTYNHSDSYPTYLGKNIADQIKPFISSTEGIEWLKSRARKLRLVDEESKPTEKDKKSFAKFANLGVSTQSEDDWYCLLREFQGHLVHALDNTLGILDIGVMIDSHNFIKDSLFCEWAYIVNLDEMTFEVYKGFQTKRHNKGRYSKISPDKNSVGDKYYACTLMATYPLTDIPTGWEEKLENDNEE